MFPLLLPPTRAAGLETTRAARLLGSECHERLVGITASAFLTVGLISLTGKLEGNAVPMDLGTGAAAPTLDHHRQRPLECAERPAKAAG